MSRAQHFASFAAYVAQGENPSWLRALHERLAGEHRPIGPTEAHLVWLLALAVWRAERAARLDGTEIDLEPAMRAQQVQLDAVERVVRQLRDLRAARGDGFGWAIATTGARLGIVELPPAANHNEPGRRAADGRSPRG